MSCVRSASPTVRLRVVVDERDERGGDKVWNWIKKGVPVRIEVGPRDLEKDALFVGRRDRAPKDKQSIARVVSLSAQSSAHPAIHSR